MKKHIANNHGNKLPDLFSAPFTDPSVYSGDGKGGGRSVYSGAPNSSNTQQRRYSVYSGTSQTRAQTKYTCIQNPPLKPKACSVYSGTPQEIDDFLNAKIHRFKGTRTPSRTVSGEAGRPRLKHPNRFHKLKMQRRPQ